MTESKLLEILARNGIENSNTTEAPHFPKLSLDYVRCISKNIADILYNSLTIRNTANENKRLDMLLLLRKWCGNNGNHFKINHINYDCLIDALNNCTLISDELQTQIKLDDCDEPEKFNFNDLLIQHYKQVEVIDKEKSKSLEIIRNRDRNKCGGDTSFVPSTFHNVKYSESPDSFLVLKQLMDLQGCEELIPVKKAHHKQSCSFKHSEPLMRQKQIGLAYSLLNLNKSSIDMLLLTDILKKISNYEILQPCEAEFIDYLWQKSMVEDFPPEIPLLLLENFRFIYEKIFIKMCTDALQTSSTQSVPLMSEDIQKILQLSSKSERLHNNITNLFYELYACSGFNKKLCCFFTLIR